MSSPNPDYEALISIITRRRTLKSLASAESMWTLSDTQNQMLENDIRSVLEHARWAPFHFDRQRNGIAEPWRVHIFDQSKCRTIAEKFGEWFDDVKPGNKLPGLLRGCGCLLLVHWIPQTAEEIANSSKRDEVNLEHHAATAALVQNILLLLTALGYENYWSSGGQLATSAFHSHCGIPLDEKLVAAVFVEPKIEWGQNSERLTGKLRSQRSDPGKWTNIQKIEP